ncbi:MAG: MFS transporter [Actinomycetales bacterium]
MDNTVLNVAIPSLVHDLRLTAGQTQWVVDAYSLVFAGLLLTAGGLSDKFGRKKGLLLGLAVFGLGSAAAALSGSAAQLVLTRGLMGVGGAFLMPGTLSILVQVFDADERGGAIGIWGGVSALGVAAGPVVGGALVTHFWWGSVFLVNVPVIAIAIVAAAVLVPESRNPVAARPDVPGALLVTVGMVSLVWAIIGAPEHGWATPRTVAAAVIGVLALAGFVVRQRTTTQPLLDLGLLGNRRFAGASATGLLLMFALAGTTFLLTQYLQLVLGYTPIGAGLRTVPVALAVGMTAPVSDRLARRLGNGETVALGLSTLAVGMVTIALAATVESYWPVLLGGAMLGAGMGCAIAPASAALMSSLPTQQAGVGSALNDTLQELGAAFGVAVLGTVAAAAYGSELRGASAAARRSLADALAESGQRGDLALADHARQAFDVAMRQGLLAPVFHDDSRGRVGGV